MIFGALSAAMPERLLAGSADSLWITVCQGRDRSDDAFTQTVFQLGGMGARATMDGLSTTGFPSGVAGIPAEVVESLCPLVFHTRELLRDSGGAGRFRGGLGQGRVLTCSTDDPWTISGLLDRTRHPAPGVDEGKSGAPGAYRLVGGGNLPPQRVVTLDPSSGVELRLPGGGGYGRPFDRDVTAVFNDVVDEYVSIERARDDYGVVIRYTGPDDALVRPPASYELDFVSTTNLRQRRNDRYQNERKAS